MVDLMTPQNTFWIYKERYSSIEWTTSIAVHPQIKVSGARCGGFNPNSF
jgi:hypothetical protein